jgi:hypothetical protein
MCHSTNVATFTVHVEEATSALEAHERDAATVGRPRRTTL